MYEFYRPTRLSGGMTDDPEKQVKVLREEIKNADAVLIGAGRGFRPLRG